MENAPKQPIYLYQLDVKWKMYHEDPYRGESKNDEISRLEYCRSDHGDDLMVVFGEEFIKGSLRSNCVDSRPDGFDPRMTAISKIEIML